MPGKTTRIILNNVSKQYNIGFRNKQSALQRLASLVSGKEGQKPIKVVDNITLKIGFGEIFGIAGPNGSGKSTLLKIIAGICVPDQGSVEIAGNIISLINLYVGLKERMTMKGNIFLIGSLFGMGQKDIKKNFDAIVEFSGLNSFVDTKIYQFSSGMMQRLVFSIAIHANPGILLLDEVFEFGDVNFHQKSMDKIKEMVSQGIAVVLVTHDPEIIRKHCHKAVLLRAGRVAFIGDPDQVAREYAGLTLQLDHG
jgi:ABC-type polysaccharide/polyol phosphate transport system ATPase subunit